MLAQRKLQKKYIKEQKDGLFLFSDVIHGEMMPRSVKREVKRCAKLRTELNLAELGFHTTQLKKEQDFSISHLQADKKKN